MTINRLKPIKTIQKRARNHLGRKAAFFYTYGYNKAMRSLVGNFPKQEGKNETYKRARVFRNSLIRTVKPLTGNSTLYRGVSGPNAQKVRNIVSNGRTNYNRNSFSSFSLNFGKSLEFANKKDPIVLMIKNPKGLPSINYGKHGFITMFNEEKEILLPPGRFTIITKIGGPNKGVPYTAYVVKFTQRSSKTSNLEKRANALQRVPATNNNKNINMNKEWRNRNPFESKNQQSLRIISKARSKLPRDIPKMNQTILNHYSRNNPNFNRYAWKNILKNFTNRANNITGRRIKIPFFLKDSNLISKKFSQQIMAFVWSKMTNAEKLRFRQPSNR